MSMFLSLENISVLFFQVIEAKDNKTSNKYSVKPPKDLRSKFEMKMEDKQRKEEEEKEKKLLDEEAQRIAVRMSKDYFWREKAKHSSEIKQAFFTP